AAPTCQILPADFPGHQNYCPYTADRKNGVWHGPDMAKAVQLAKASGTTHVPVTVLSSNDRQGKALGSYLARLLRQLGYRATVRDVSSNQYFTIIFHFNAHRKIQMGAFEPRGGDSPTPSTFSLPLLPCHSFYADPANTHNLAGFCDPHVDKLASQAQAVQLTDPAAARRRWARVDRIVTDQAPWAPLFDEVDTV